MQATHWLAAPTLGLPASRGGGGPAAGSRAAVQCLRKLARWGKRGMVCLSAFGETGVTFSLSMPTTVVKPPMQRAKVTVTLMEGLLMRLLPRRKTLQ